MSIPARPAVFRGFVVFPAVLCIGSSAGGQVCRDWSIMPNPVYSGEAFRPAHLYPLGPERVMSVRGFVTGGSLHLQRTLWDGSSWTVLGTEPVDVPLDIGADVDKAFVVSPEDIWVTGQVGLSPFWGVPWIGHFDGGRWDWWQGTMLDQADANGGQVERSGSPVDLVFNAADDIWVIGSATTYFPNSGRTLLAHWDGSRLEEFPPIPNVYSRLQHAHAAAGSGTDDAWVVGHGRNSGSFHLFILHYDGSTWAPLMDWAPLTNETIYSDGLDDIVAFSSTDAWAVGDKLVMGGANLESRSLYLHWDGRSWTEVEGPNIGPLTSIAGSGPDDIWASCVYGEYGGRLAHYDGVRWTEYDSAAIPGATHIGLTNLASAGPCAAWAIGSWGIYDGAGGWSEFHDMIERVGEGAAGPQPCGVCDRVDYGVVEIGDLLSYLSDYFDGSGDLNGDGGTTISDLLVFLGCYFELAGGC